MRKVFPLLLAAVLCISISLTTFASPEPTILDDGFSVTTENTLLPPEEEQEKDTPLSPLPKPYDIEFTQLNRVSTVVMYYRMDADTTTDTLFPDATSIGNESFTLFEVLEESQPPVTKVKNITVPISVSSDTDNKKDILAELPQTMEYNENGFTGTLTLSTAAIDTEVVDTTYYSYPTETTKEFTGLDRADMSYIPKSYNGMALVDVSWTSLGGTQRGDTIAPSHYTATAIYGGTATGSKATGYHSTLYYEGEVTQEIPSQSLYKAIYVQDKVVFYKLLPAIGIIVVLLCLLAITLLKKPNNGRDYYNEKN